MNTLIIPCAGKSSRFPGMKPKWLLTCPDGQLMIQKAIAGLNLEIFERIIITIVRPHDEQYEAGLILSQAFATGPSVEICMLDDFTSGAAETILLTLAKMQVCGAFVVKDSDNFVAVTLPATLCNHLVGYDVHRHPEVPDIPGKSFVIADEQGQVIDIVEKHVVSGIICVGIYIFAEPGQFREACSQLLRRKVQGELYISQVISHILAQGQSSFTLLEAEQFEDWGTLQQWRTLQRKSKTYFVDLDGVLLENTGNYGSCNWSNTCKVLSDNVEVLRGLQAAGAQLVITTSRPESQRPRVEQLLAELDLTIHALLMGLQHAPRVIINDFAPTNPYPCAEAISLPRNAALRDYLT